MCHFKDWEREKWLAGEVKERNDGKDNAAVARESCAGMGLSVVIP